MYICFSFAETNSIIMDVFRSSSFVVNQCARMSPVEDNGCMAHRYIGMLCDIGLS